MTQAAKPTTARTRVLIRPPCETDRAAFFSTMRASRKFHRPWVSPPLTNEAFDRYLAKSQSERHAGFLVCQRQTGHIVGVVNLNEIILGPLRSAYLGYYGVQAHTRLGYMTEGVTLVLRHAFRRMALHRLEANIQPANGRSIALAQRCGFEFEGTSRRYLKIAGRWRDHQRWAVVKEWWRTGDTR